MTKTIIDISNASGPGIIIECPSSIKYTRQTGGIYINMPSIEGCYIPLEFDYKRHGKQNEAHIISELHSMFDFTSVYGGRSHEIYEDTANELDALIEKITKRGPIILTQYGQGIPDSRSLSKIKVDRTMLAKSQEAWVHITLTNGNMPMKGIFTWENSD